MILQSVLCFLASSKEPPVMGTGLPGQDLTQRCEARSWSMIPWVQESCCTGSRPRLNVESLLWELLANSPPMADDEEILPDVMDLLLWMQVQMYTNKLNLPIKTSGRGISYILLHIRILSTFVCLNLSHSPLIFLNSHPCPGGPLLLKHAFNERPAKLKSYPLPCFDQVPKHTLFTEIRQLFPMKDYTST